MRKPLTDEGYANIFANMLGPGLQTLVADEDGSVYGFGGLSIGLMEAACNNLRIRTDAAGPPDFGGTYVLAPEPVSELYITPEELNAKVAGHPEASVLVFIPEEHRAALEGHFAPSFFRPVDTFRTLEDMERRLIGRINQVPVYKRVAALWTAHAIDRIPILMRIDYLINVISLCLSHDEMGMFFHKLDLIPDRNPDVTGDFGARLTRNAMAVAALCDPAVALERRAAALGIEDRDLEARLGALLEGLSEMTPGALGRAVFDAERGAGQGDGGAGLSFDRWRFQGEPGWT